MALIDYTRVGDYLLPNIRLGEPSPELVEPLGQIRPYAAGVPAGSPSDNIQHTPTVGAAISAPSGC